MDKSMGTASPKAGEGWASEQSPSLLLSLPLPHRLPFLAALGLCGTGCGCHPCHPLSMLSTTASMATTRGRCCPAPAPQSPALLLAHVSASWSSEGRGKQLPKVSPLPGVKRSPQLHPPVPTMSGSLTVVPSEKGGKGETPTRLQGALSDLRGEGPQPQGRAGGQPEDILSVGLQAFHRERRRGLEVLQHLGVGEAGREK